MKKALTLLLVPASVALATSLGSAATAPTPSVKEVVVGLSPFYPLQDQNVVSQAVVRLWFTLPPNTPLTIEDAYNRTRITTATIPKLDFDSPKARFQRLQGPIGELNSWFLSSSHQSSNRLSNSSSLRLPEWLARISDPARSSPRCVVLIGSPFYSVPEMPTFDMRPDRYPSDGLLNSGLKDSVFGLQEKRSLLPNTLVRFCLLPKDTWKNDLHEDRVRRFWSLFLSGQSAQLAEFSGDLKTLLSHVSSLESHQAIPYSLDPNDTRLEMVEVPDRPTPERQLTLKTVPTIVTNFIVVEREIVKPTPPPVAPQVVFVTNTLPVRWEDTWTPPKPTSTLSDKPRISLGWAAPNVDLDIRVVPNEGSKELSWLLKETPEGQYLYDYQNANDGIGFETVVLNRPIDLDQAKVWVNFFNGQSPSADGVKALVLLEENGKTYRSQFTFHAPHGNKGQDASQRASSPCWFEVKLKDLVNSQSSLLTHSPLTP